MLCLGPDRNDGEPTYVPIDDWIDPKLAKSPKAPLAELARRYFEAYGPASLADLVAWSGLPVSEARSALVAARPSLAEVTIRGQPAFLPKARLAERPEHALSKPGVRLLPAFDAYLLGYRSRDLAVPAKLQQRLQRGGGWLHPAVVVNGRAVAAWSLKKTGDRGEAHIESIAPLPTAMRKAIAEEVADIGRFLDLQTSAKFETLTQ